jgi:phosphatidate cytidylyltransferase
MGAVLIALVAGVLFVDQWLAPWFPFLFLLIAGLALAATMELLHLLKPSARPPGWLCLAGIGGLVVANWLPHLPWWPFDRSVSALLVGVLAALVIAVFLAEMAAFKESGQSVARVSAAVWLFAYLGLLPSFLAQLRWLSPMERGTAALALTVFVPKTGDIGAYFTGRLLGRHRMAPVLSPKKTWEGACGGLALATLTAIALDRAGPAPVLHEKLAVEIGFGLSVGLAGMLGDLGESLIKRDCEQKEASQSVPGFGGVLDVADAILFAAPVSYLWLKVLC